MTTLYFNFLIYKTEMIIIPLQEQGWVHSRHNEWQLLPSLLISFKESLTTISSTDLIPIKIQRLQTQGHSWLGRYVSLAPGLWSRDRWTSVEDSLRLYSILGQPTLQRDHVSKKKKKPARVGGTHLS